MNACPVCHAHLSSADAVCPYCGAALSGAGTVFENEPDGARVTVTVAPGEARRGCLRTVRYPGAPEPLCVELPAPLKDGMALYVAAPFLVGNGALVERPLRIVVHVRRPRRRYAAAAALLFTAAAALGVLLFVFSRDLRRDTVDPDAGTAALLPEQSAQGATLVSAAPTQPPVPTEPPLSEIERKARDMIPHFELRYYLNQLDDRLLENFCALYESVSSFAEQCSFPQDLSKSELSHLTLLLSYECPELLQFSAATEITFYSDVNGNVVSAQLPLSMTKEQYAQEYRVCSGVAAALAQKARGLSEQEKEMLAYNYLTSNCYYNYDAPNACSAYGALGDREAKCDGISLAMKWLCEEMGISCMVMAGNSAGNPIGHAWNILCIDGTYYDLDVTNDVNSPERSYNYYGAFNVSRHWIRSKYPENVSFAGFVIVPGSESMNMSYHALNGSFVPAGEVCDEKLYEQLNGLASGEAAYLQFESWDDYTAFIANANDVMSRWSGLSRGSFNYSLSHLDEFQVCRISITYL